MKFIYDGGKENLMSLLDLNKMRGIKMIDSSVPHVPDSDSSSEEEGSYFVIKGDVNRLNTMVGDLVKR